MISSSPHSTSSLASFGRAPPGTGFHCSVCGVFFSDQRSAELHKTTLKHKQRSGELEKELRLYKKDGDVTAEDVFAMVERLREELHVTPFSALRWKRKQKQQQEKEKEEEESKEALESSILPLDDAPSSLIETPTATPTASMESSSSSIVKKPPVDGTTSLDKQREGEGNVSVESLTTPSKPRNTPAAGSLAAAVAAARRASKKS